MAAQNRFKRVTFGSDSWKRNFVWPADFALRRWVFLFALSTAAGCADPPPSSQTEPIASSAQAVDIGGCTCVPSGTCAELSYADIPADGIYYLTTFGGGTETQTMS